MSQKNRKKKSTPKFIQSSSGYIIELSETGSRRLNLKQFVELVESKVQEDVILNRNLFNMAYGPELFTLRVLHEQKKKEEEEKKKLEGNKPESLEEPKKEEAETTNPETPIHPIVPEEK